jgi:hypothetical protein
MTHRISRERCLPQQGGFETRPYKLADLCALSRKKDPLSTHGLPVRPGVPFVVSAQDDWNRPAAHLQRAALMGLRAMVAETFQGA